MSETIAVEQMEVVTHEGQTTISVVCGLRAAGEVALRLVMLKEQIVNAVLLTSGRDRFSLSVTLLPTGSGQRSRVQHQGSQAALQVTSHDLEALLHFYLKYCRDGYAEVDHIDMQAQGGSTIEEDVYVTFIATESSPPVNSEAAKRRLGL